MAAWPGRPKIKPLENRTESPRVKYLYRPHARTANVFTEKRFVFRNIDAFLHKVYEGRNRVAGLAMRMASARGEEH